MKQSKKLLTSVALIAALAIPFASTSQAAEEETTKPTPVVDEQGNPDEGRNINDDILKQLDPDISKEDADKQTLPEKTEGETFVNDGTIIDEGVNDKEADKDGIITDKENDDKTPTIKDLIKDETPADKDENGKPDDKKTPLPDGMEWISDEEIENGVIKKESEDFIFDEEGYILDGKDKKDANDKEFDNKKAKDEDSDLTWDDIIKKHGVDENGYVKNGEYEDWHDRDSDYILDGKDENDLTWDDIKDKNELQPPVIFDPAKKEDKDKNEDDKKPMDKPDNNPEDDKKPMDKPTPTTPEAPVKPAPIIPRHTNPKTGVAGIGSIAGLLTMASFAFVGTKKNK